MGFEDARAFLCACARLFTYLLSGTYLLLLTYLLTYLPPTPTMAATEESASERWWKALATSVGAAVRVPTAWVMRKSHSFLVGVGCGAGVRRRHLPSSAAQQRGRGGGGRKGCSALPHAHVPRSVARYWCRLVPLADAARLTDERLHASNNPNPNH